VERDAEIKESEYRRQEPGEKTRRKKSEPLMRMMELIKDDEIKGSEEKTRMKRKGHRCFELSAEKWGGGDLIVKHLYFLSLQCRKQEILGLYRMYRFLHLCVHPVQTTHILDH
jgi:hypothetical protein